MYFPGGTWIILAVVNTSSLSIGNPHKFNVFLHVVLTCMMSSECHVSAVVVQLQSELSAQAGVTYGRQH